MSSPDNSPSLPDSPSSSGSFESSQSPSRPDSPASSDILDYLYECELDSNGNKIPDGILGWKLSERGRAAEDEFCKVNFKDRQPMSQISSTLLVLPETPYNHPPVLYWALPFDTQQMLDFNERHGIPLVDVPNEKYAMRISMAVKQGMSRLRDLCELWSLKLVMPIDMKHEWGVGLYSNYTWYDEALIPEDEKDVVEIIKKELKIEKPPMWYYDSLS
ncbi:hypothetical protein EWM64_g9927 [Hericium alpestre]|uniref:Uncharacterized protein n=1 Tax=Hericium alpestre TaxID=135208 RepID=A0A4Y9ZH59_9AGAM|nr:hypothetical protein EWM64_g9927 [Hericium alpestre]